MFALSIRPLLRIGTRQATRHASSSTRSASSPTSRYAVVAGLTVVVGALALTSERRRLWNDDRQHSYDEDLKTNRHKAAAQVGATPETPLHNSSTSAKSIPVPAVNADEPKSSSTKKSSPIPGDLDEAAATEEQASQEGAFNEETGEINWDCPCLGGMAHGPCGEEFRAAFSCFVFSEQEPKGIDCVEKFKGMQDCFRKHPDIYGEEIDDDEPESDESPLNTTEVAISTDGHDGKVPKSPVSEPPAHSPIPAQTPENNPSKGVSMHQPSAVSKDKAVVGAAPGDGTI